MKEKKDEKIKSKSKKNKKKSPLVKFFIIIFIILLLLIIAFLVFKLNEFTKLAKEMFNNAPSTVYDTNNSVIAQIGTERNRNNIKYSSIPENLVNAYVSIEDQRFFSHHGVDIKRTGAAIVSYIIKRGSSSFGGSTITQQLVKNLTGDDSSSIVRKVKEWGYSIALELAFSKEEILEAYLNIIYTGPNLYGVQNAAKYYFNKDVSELSLAECAFLSGLTHSPNTYNPFSNSDKTEKITKRTKTVLNKMLELKYISEEQFNAAIVEVENGLKFSKGEIQTDSNIYSYNSDAIINEIIVDFSNKKHISQTFATNYFYLSGSKVYSTQNSSIQADLENESKNKKYILKSENGDQTSQTAMVIIDHSTGHVLGSIGGLGEKTTSRGFNRVTQMKRQTGSAMKPIAVLAPAISKKIITNVSVYADVPTTFTDYNGESYSPTDYDDYKGSITLRQAVESSQNIPFVKIMEQLTPEVSIKYLKKMGITTLNEKDKNLSLALGGLDIGISPLEFAGAYACIANDGVYIEPTFYTKITSNSNQVILKSKQKTRRVFSKDVAYILKELLTEPVKGTNGTATYCAISGIDVAAKTGTTNDNYDRWLCGFTPYYTAVCWYGFDINESIHFNGKNPAGIFWSSVMKKIHSGLSKASFQKTNGVVTATICRDSGKVANSNCPNTFTEFFLKGTIPTTCTQHSSTNKQTNTTKNTNTPKNETSTNNQNKQENSYEENTTIQNEKTPPIENKNTTSENTSVENKTTHSTNSIENTITNTTTTNTTPSNTENSNSSSQNNSSSENTIDNGF